jgi:glutaredoxin-related protein
MSLNEALVAATKEILLEVNADKTEYMVMSRDQNAGRNHSMKTDNNSFESLEEFKYLGTTLSNQNSIQEDVKSRLKLGIVLLLFGAESFVFQCAIQKIKD